MWMNRSRGFVVKVSNGWRHFDRFVLMLISRMKTTYWRRRSHSNCLNAALTHSGNAIAVWALYILLVFIKRALTAEPIQLPLLNQSSYLVSYIRFAVCSRVFIFWLLAPRLFATTRNRHTLPVSSPWSVGKGVLAAKNATLRLKLLEWLTLKVTAAFRSIEYCGLTEWMNIAQIFLSSQFYTTCHVYVYEK